MLATFVIGLREGLEAALIVGIIAAFLTGGRADALRFVWIGVALTVAACVAFAVGLQLWSTNLPYKEQETLETVLGFAAVGMVTYIDPVDALPRPWPATKPRSGHRLGPGHRQHDGPRGDGRALRCCGKRLETAVFLLAAFNASESALAAGVGALARRPGRGRGRIRDLSGRRPPQPYPLLPDHRRGPRVRGGRPRSPPSLHSAYEQVGSRSATPMGTWAGDPRGAILSALFTGVLGHSGRADGDRGHRLFRLPRPHAPRRPVARSTTAADPIHPGRSRDQEPHPDEPYLAPHRPADQWASPPSPWRARRAHQTAPLPAHQPDPPRSLWR